MNHKAELMDVAGLAAFLETAPVDGALGRMALVMAEALRQIDHRLGKIEKVPEEVAGHIAADMPLVRTLEKLTIEPGDMVLVTLDETVSPHVRDVIVRQLRTLLTRDGYVPNVVVKDRRAKLEIVSGSHGDSAAG